MPRLANDRQELYCKMRANGFVPKRAATAAGYATGSAIYTQLEADPDVVTRVNELMDERQAKQNARNEAARVAGQVAGEMMGVSQAWVLEQLKLNAEEARSSGDFKESNAAIFKIGEHFGMWGAQVKGAGPSTNHAGESDNLQLDRMANMDAIDKLIAVTDRHDDSEVKVIDQAVMMRLIEGSQPINKAKTLTTGSETDVAMRQADDDGDPFEEIPL